MGNSLVSFLEDRELNLTLDSFEDVAAPEIVAGGGNG